MKRLVARPLTAGAFRPFGEVIDASGGAPEIVNAGAAEVYRDLAQVDVQAGGGRVCISLVRAAPARRPLAIETMERHPLGSQAFVPLDGARLIVIVAPAGELDPGAIVAFVASGSQGVNYRRGVWHHPLLALDRASAFVVIDRKGEGDNLELRRLAAPLTVEIGE